MAIRLDRDSLIRRLSPVTFERSEDERDSHLEQMSLAGALLNLAGIDHEHEYQLCRQAALHLLGSLNEPEDIQLE